MINVTVTLDEETVRAVRVKAAERGMSLSRYVGEVLRRHTGWSGEYEAAYRAFLAQKPIKLKGRFLTREEAHDRAGLRRR